VCYFALQLASSFPLFIVKISTAFNTACSLPVDQGSWRCGTL
jgi:hypothetical protein